jgi:hypothetical protein
LDEQYSELANYIYDTPPNPVIYDLITDFKDGPMKDPFVTRKNTLRAPEIKKTLKDQELYGVNEYMINLQRASICLDNNKFSTFNVFSKQVYDKCDDGSDFNIMQFLNYQFTTTKEFKGMLAFLTITPNQIYTKYDVTSFKFTDMLGEVGGFMDGILLLISFFVGRTSALSYGRHVSEETADCDPDEFKDDSNKGKNE